MFIQMKFIWMCLFTVTVGDNVYNPEKNRKVSLNSTREVNATTTLYNYDNNLNIKYISSVLKQTGLWLYYSSDYYRGHQVTAIIATDFTYSLGHNLASLRYGGNSRGVHFPSLSLYSDTWFRGEEYAVEVGYNKKTSRNFPQTVPNFRGFDRIRSILITGGDWVVFSGENILGDCRCLTSTYFAYLDDGNYVTSHGGVYQAGFFPFLNTTGLDSIGSAVFGCGYPFETVCPRVTWTAARTSNGDIRVSKPPCPVITNQSLDPCGH